MNAESLIWTMAAHMAWVVLLFAALTLARAPDVWGVYRRDDGSNPWAGFETRISANLRNQFEWPLFFYVICLLLLQQDVFEDTVQVWLAWLFIAGRIAHSAVQVFGTNVRLRGIVFTVNFLAVLAMWVRFLLT